MKRINLYIQEKLHISKYNKNYTKDIYIKLGEFLFVKTNISQEKQWLKDILQGKKEIDDDYYITADLVIFDIIEDPNWKFSKEENEKLKNLIMDIENEKAKKDEIDELNRGIIQGFKNVLKGHGLLKKYINESLEDNLFWKIDKYFENHDNEKKIFIDMIDYFRDHPGFNKKNIEDYIQDKEFKNMKKFLDFLDDIVKQEDTNRDYNYILYLVIKNIILNKVEGEKYTNKK